MRHAGSARDDRRVSSPGSEAWSGARPAAAHRPDCGHPRRARPGHRRPGRRRGVAERPGHQGLRRVRSGPRQAGPVPHRGPGGVRQPELLRLHPDVRSGARQDPQAPRPARHPHRERPDQDRHRFLPRPALGVRVRHKPRRRQAGLRHLQRQQRGRRVGRGLGGEDHGGLPGLDRGVQDPAVPDALREERLECLRLRDLAGHRPVQGAGELAALSQRPGGVRVAAGRSGRAHRARRPEVSPYAVTKNITLPKGTNDYSHPQRVTGGLDFKYGVSSNLTVDGTVNPDFGQVEADPSVLNLTSFETFFQGRPPFFIEGGGLLSFRINCYAVHDCGSENLFYSRRIGRSPQLADSYGDAASATGTTILGAAKLTGRTPGGLSIGAIEAVTGREEGTLNSTIEPRSNYAVFRATQDFRHGETGIGVIGTMVDRSLDQWTRPSLRSGALVGGLDFRHRFLKSRFEVVTRVVGSRVEGSAPAIAATQLSSVHFYQRPDSPLDFDSTRTSLRGDAEEITFGKVGGGLLRFETSYQRVSPGFEANDLGYLRRADWQDQATWASLNWNKPGPFFRRLFWK